MAVGTIRAADKQEYCTASSSNSEQHSSRSSILLAVAAVRPVYLQHSQGCEQYSRTNSILSVAGPVRAAHSITVVTAVLLHFTLTLVRAVQRSEQCSDCSMEKYQQQQQLDQYTSTVLPAITGSTVLDIAIVQVVQKYEQYTARGSNSMSSTRV